MQPRRLVALALAALALVPAPARACWTGLAADLPGVRLQLHDEAAGAWDPASVQAFATWLTRIDELVADDLEILAGDRDLTLFCDTCPDDRRLRWDGRPATLFDRVARELGVDRDTRLRALAVDATAYTVQVAAFADRADADALAARINDDPESTPAHGFVEIGAHPGMNPSAHVVTVDHAGAPVHRVLVGAFLSRADAEVARTSVHADAGLRGWVRPLV